MKKLLLSTLLVAILLLIIGCTAVDFDISFVSDGQVVHTVSTSGSEAITLPNNPVKEGFVFEGWYWDKDTWEKPFTASSLLNEPLTANMSVYAKWTPEVVPPQNYTVTFNSMGGSLVNEQVLLFGDFISKPVDPIKTNYAFGGWYLDKDYTVTWDFAVGVVTEDSTLYAKWIDKYLVTLNVNGGTLESDTEGEFYIVDGEKISQLPAPTRELYTFGGWYKDEACTTPWDLGIDAVDENTILFAKWIKQHLVTLYANGGTLSEDVEAKFYREDGERIGKLPTPTRKGYTFLGWYFVDDIALEEKITRTFEVECDIDLIAQWQQNVGEGALVTVELILNTGESLKLDENGNEPSSVIELEIGDRLGKLPEAKLEGFRFKGWYDDKGVQYTYTSIITADIKLTARWQKISYCLDGTENHDWASTGGYKIKSEATCTTPEIMARVCGVPGCGVTETIETSPALGHSFNWNYNTPMERTGVCSVCSETVFEKLTDVTLIALGKNNPQMNSTAGWGMNQGAILIDNNWTNTTIAGNQKPVTCTLEFEETTYVDLIYIAGIGSSSYVVTWYDVGGEEVGFARGSFGDVDDGSHINRFEVGAEISKVVIYMETTSYGTCYWSEVRLAQYPEE